MSKMGDFLTGLKASIAGAGIGLHADNIIDEPEGNVWNEISAAVGKASRGIALIMDEVQGDNQDQESEDLNFNLTVALTVAAEPNWHLQDANNTESVRLLIENLWKHVHGLQITTGAHAKYEVRVRGWGKVQNRKGYVMRQIVVQKLLEVGS